MWFSLLWKENVQIWRSNGIISYNVIIEIVILGKETQIPNHHH